MSARVELAALYRLIDKHFPSTDGIYNHVSMRCPDKPGAFLIKRHHLLYEEVTASNLVVAELQGQCDEQSDINRPGFVLHSAILRARPEIQCVVHIHSVVGIAMATHGSGLRMLCQNALRFYKRMGRHAYEGITDDDAEGSRIALALGERNIALLLENHGLVVVGRSAREAFERTRDLLIACEVQLALEATGSEPIEIPPHVCERVADQFIKHDSGRGTADWPAWLRHLDRFAPDFRS